MNEWIEAINLVAATYSAPPLPAPVGSWYNKLTCTHYSMIINLKPVYPCLLNNSDFQKDTYRCIDILQKC